jgi:hypothetical protein
MDIEGQSAKSKCKFLKQIQIGQFLLVEETVVPGENHRTVTSH